MAGGFLNIAVTRTGGSLGTVAVNYAMTDGTARTGVDYNVYNGAPLGATTGTLTFPNGDTTQSINIAIANIPGYKGDRSFSLALGAPAGTTLGAPAAATVTIVEDDPVPPPLAPGSFQFADAAFSVLEDGSGDGTGPDGVASIVITRSGGSDGTQTVPIGLSDGTAVRGTDYLSPTAANLAGLRYRRQRHHLYRVRSRRDQ